MPSFVRRLVDHQSAYLEFEWAILDQLTFIAEGRYVEEDNEISSRTHRRQPGPGHSVALRRHRQLCTHPAAYRIRRSPGFRRLSRARRSWALGGYARSESYVTPKGTLQWRPLDNLNLYASYSEGRKPGGFATLTTGAFGLPARPDVEFESEKIKVYELGSKWTSENRRFRSTAPTSSRTSPTSRSAPR